MDPPFTACGMVTNGNVSEEAMALLLKHIHDEDASTTSDSSNNIDIQDNRRLTAFYQATADGQVGAVRLLLEAGAAVDVFDNKGITPLALAGENEFLGTVEWLHHSANFGLGRYVTLRGVTARLTYRLDPRAHTPTTVKSQDELCLITSGDRGGLHVTTSPLVPRLTHRLRSAQVDHSLAVNHATAMVPRGRLMYIWSKI